MMRICLDSVYKPRADKHRCSLRPFINVWGHFGFSVSNIHISLIWFSSSKCLTWWLPKASFMPVYDYNIFMSWDFNFFRSFNMNKPRKTLANQFTETVDCPLPSHLYFCSPPFELAWSLYYIQDSVSAVKDLPRKRLRRLWSDWKLRTVMDGMSQSNYNFISL